MRREARAGKQPAEITPIIRPFVISNQIVPTPNVAPRAQARIATEMLLVAIELLACGATLTTDSVHK